jgi:O-antigen biosynthesis protein WbqP
MKRLFDIILALIIIIPATIIVFLAAIPAFIECRASPFFFQTRVGLHQVNFKLIKLRTMLPNTENLASHHVSADNVTRTGQFFRRTKIDELPQIWNVLLGQMSFVGPRPCLPGQTDLLDAREIRGVYNLMPGITGVAQVQGIDMSTPEELANADASYPRRWSLMFDAKLILATAFGSGRGDAVGKRS